MGDSRIAASHKYRCVRNKTREREKEKERKRERERVVTMKMGNCTICWVAAVSLWTFCLAAISFSKKLGTLGSFSRLALLSCDR